MVDTLYGYEPTNCCCEISTYVASVCPLCGKSIVKIDDGPWLHCERTICLGPDSEEIEDMELVF